jgi:ComEC/Rec2-related protein
VSRIAPQTCAALAACAGIVLSLVVRAPAPWLLAAAALALVARARAGVALLAAVALAGWWWGSVRVDALAKSAFAHELGRGGDALVEVVAPPRHGAFELRVVVRVLRFDGARSDERVLAELPLSSRAPPQGARLAILGVLKAPRGPQDGFDERTWLARQGIHAVLRAKAWRVVGARSGLAASGDVLRRRLANGLAGHGTGRAVAAGVLLGDDGDLSDGVRNDFRASGLYHLLAVSGQNVAILAGAVLGLAWLLGLPRVAGHLLGLAAIGAYTLAVGPQPSVIRAAVAGALASVAFLAGVLRDRWHALVLGALVLLAWNPWNLLDPGFQLSFAAVVAIFVLAPRIERRLEGYPLPRRTRLLVAVSSACSLATAPVSWIEFHRISLVAVPANLVADAAVAPLLVLALAAATLAPFAPGGAHVLGLGATELGAYVALCAHVFARIPGAQVTTTRGLALLALAVTAACLCLRRWRRPSSSPST